MTTPAPVAHLKLMIFLDFWNYTLNMQDFNPSFQTDWFALPRAIALEASNILLTLPSSSLDYGGIFIAGSYNQLSPNDTRLKNWATNTLIKVPGAEVDFKARQKMQRGPCCTGPDHHEVHSCPECGATMKGTREKGVDTQLVTEMLRRAWEGTYNIGIIVSEDRDFVPAITYLSQKGFKFIHARFPNSSFELRRHCWGEIDLTKICSQFQRAAIAT